MVRICRPSGHKSRLPLQTSPSYIDIPMVHIRDSESEAYVVRQWLDWHEVLGSNPTGVLSLVWLPKSCWWDLAKVKTAVQVLADVERYVFHSCFKNRKLPPTYNPACKLRVVFWLQSTDWYCDANMSSKWVKFLHAIENLLILHGIFSTSYMECSFCNSSKIQ